ADRHFDEATTDGAGDAIDHAAADHRLADAGAGRPPRATLEEILDRDREIVIRVHQTGASRDNAVPVVIRVAGPRYVEALLHRDEAPHRVRRRAVHPDAAVPIHAHEAEGRIDLVAHDRQRNAVALGDHPPVRDAGPAEWIDAELELRAAQDVEVEYGGQVGDV